MARTDLPYCPWTTMGADDPEHAEEEVSRFLCERWRRPCPSPLAVRRRSVPPERHHISVDLLAMMSDEEYKEKLLKGQGSMREAQCRPFKTKWRLVVVF